MRVLRGSSVWWGGHCVCFGAVWGGLGTMRGVLGVFWGGSCCEGVLRVCVCGGSSVRFGGSGCVFWGRRGGFSVSRRLLGGAPYEGAASEGGEISLWRSRARGCVPEALGLRRPGLCPCAERRLPREAQVVLGGPVPTVGSRARKGPAFGHHLGTT